MSDTQDPLGNEYEFACNARDAAADAYELALRVGTPSEMDLALAALSAANEAWIILYDQMNAP